MNYHVVKYSGPFGFIKPWTAVRDIETFSQQFLTPSIIEGIEKKLFPHLLDFPNRVTKIKRHRISYTGIDTQQERTWSKGGFKAEKKKDSLGRTYYQPENIAIIKRGVMLNPYLYLAFDSEEEANTAATQHVCLCRNEDVLLPEEALIMREDEFDKIEGFELLIADESTGFKVGHNRFASGEEMFGELKVFGNPIRQD
jgi:hypothetical protein